MSEMVEVSEELGIFVAILSILFPIIVLAVLFNMMTSLGSMDKSLQKLVNILGPESNEKTPDNVVGQEHLGTGTRT